LHEKYKDHFFACDFTSNAGSSVIWSLSVKPKGASFEVNTPKEFVKGMVPTDCEFGPDGAFYWSDWVGGWSPPGKGRLFRVTDPEAMKNPAVEEARKLLAEGFAKKTIDELAKLLEHPHQMVRQEAQFELASRRHDAPKVFADVLKNSKNQLARLHAVWGLGMVGRTTENAQEVLLAASKDKDAEVKRAAVEQLGSVVRHRGRLAQLPPTVPEVLEALGNLLKDPDDRVKAAAAIAYGKIGDLRNYEVFPGSEQAYYVPLFDLLKANNDKDPYIRHAAVMGLARSTHDPRTVVYEWTQAKAKYDTPAVRMGVLLALRKHKHEKVAAFLDDTEPRIVAEAARAVYDVRIEGAREALAKLAEKTGQPDAVAYRALAANYTLGTPEAARRVATFAGRAAEPDHARAFALKLLGDWTKPPRRDPITGLTLDLPARDARLAADALKAVGGAIFAGSDVVRREASQVVAKLKLTEFGPAMAAIVKDETQPVNLRVEALLAADALKAEGLKNLVDIAGVSKEPKLRAAALSVWAKLDPAILKQFPTILKSDTPTTVEKQAIFAVLATQRRSEETDKLLDEWLDAVIAKKVPPELILDVLDAAETRANTPKLRLFAPLKAKVEKYRGEQAKEGDKLAPFLESLAGGDAERGRNIFLNNSAVYCQRCHKLDGQGGDVGPVMNGIAAEKDRDRRYLLESIALPSAKIAKGFETVILILEDERTISGIIKSEDKTNIKLVTAENKELVIPVKEIAARRTGPSAMPDDLHKKLTRRELRDVVEFLASLKEPPKK
jgi:quinoprotein glucose dehydrogenase